MFNPSLFRPFWAKTLLVGMTVAGLAAGTPGQARAQAAPVEMVMTDEIATSHWTAKMMDEYAALIEERSKGRIKPKVFHSGTLYKDKDAVAALGSGAVHMVWPVSVQLESIAPQYGVVNLPFAVTDAAMSKPETAQEVSKLLSGLVADKGIRVMGLMRTADLIFLFKDKEVDSVGDLKGSKIRLTGGRVLQLLMRDFGASPVSMPASEMAAALMQGAIDGIYTSAGGWEMVGTNAAKVASLVPGMSLLTYSVLVDDKWMKGLPDDLRQVVETTTNEIIAKQWQRAIDADKKTMDQMIAQGGRLAVAPEAEQAKFREIANKVNQDYVRRYPEIWKQYQAIVGNKS